MIIVLFQDNLNLSEVSKHPPPLGLKLTLTPDMLPLTEQKYNAAPRFRKVDKLKAVHFPIYMLTIGAFKVIYILSNEIHFIRVRMNFFFKLVQKKYSAKMIKLLYEQIEAKYPADLVAKFYYAKRKLVWEILRDGLKEKIEIQWKNITAIRAVLQENLPGILELQVFFSSMHAYSSIFYMYFNF